MRFADLLFMTVGLFACERPCVPGSMRESGSGFQNLNFPMQPVEFALEEGSCGEGVPPAPVVRVSGLGGEQRLGTSTLRSFRPAGALENSIEVRLSFTPFEGQNRIELEFEQGVVRTGNAFFFRPLVRPTVAVIDGQCAGSLRVEGDTVACNAVADDGATSVLQASDAGLIRIDGGSLWVTPQGSLITTATSLGWWAEGAALSEWRPTGSLTARAMLAASNSSVVAIWQADSVVVLRARDDLSREVARVAVRPCDEWCELVIEMVMTEDALLLSRRGDHQMIVNDGGWTLLSESAAQPLATGRGDSFWRCDDRSIEVGRFEAGALRTIASADAPLSCGGWASSDRPAIPGGRAMLLCPRLADGVIDWDSIALNGNELGGGCFLDHAYTYSGTSPVRTRVVSLK